MRRQIGSNLDLDAAHRVGDVMSSPIMTTVLLIIDRSDSGRCTSGRLIERNNNKKGW